MLAVIKEFMTRYNHYMTRIGRERAREILLRSDDRILADAGFSRILLEEGVNAWPWRSDVEQAVLLPPKFNLVTQSQAVRELESYSDKELYDLGISRGAIPDVVRHGRPGIERENDRKVA